MIVAKSYCLKLRYGINSNQRIEFLLPFIGPCRIKDALIHIQEVGAEMPRQGRNGRLISLIDEFAVGPIGYTGFRRLVPDIGLVQYSRRSRIAAAMAIAARPDLFHIIRGISPHAPLVAICTDLSVYIKIIQQHKFTGQRVLIRSDFLPKQNQAGIAITLWYVA